MRSSVGAGKLVRRQQYTPILEVRHRVAPACIAPTDCTTVLHFGLAVQA